MWCVMSFFNVVSIFIFMYCIIFVNFILRMNAKKDKYSTKYFRLYSFFKNKTKTAL